MSIVDQSTSKENEGNKGILALGEAAKAVLGSKESALYQQDAPSQFQQILSSYDPEMFTD